MAYEKLKKETIIAYYFYLKDSKIKNMNFTEYARVHNIDYKRLNNIRYRFAWVDTENPVEKKIRQEYVNHAKEFLSLENISISKYVKQKNLNRNKFTIALAHVEYWQIINDYEKSQKKNDTFHVKNESEHEQPMIFIPVKNSQPHAMKLSDIPALPIHQEQKQELIKKQNQLELIISKGVKVIIDPKISSDRIIKIIELLKDL